jgi:hypothetical protein
MTNHLGDTEYSQKVLTSSLTDSLNHILYVKKWKGSLTRMGFNPLSKIILQRIIVKS